MGNRLLFSPRKNQSRSKKFLFILTLAAALFTVAYFFSIISIESLITEPIKNDILERREVHISGSDYDIHCSGSSCIHSQYYGRKFYMENGERKEVRTVFEPDGEGWKAEENVFRVYVKDNNISLVSEDGSQVSFSLPECAKFLNVSGNVLAYNISKTFSEGKYFIDGVLYLTLTRSGLEKMIIIRNASLFSDFEYREKFSETGNKFILEDITAWYDRCGIGENCERVYYHTKLKKGNGSVGFSVSKEWIESAKFPIYIDPTVRYNFTDSVNNRAYVWDYNGAQPPAWSDGWSSSATEVSSSCYSNLSASDNVYCIYTTTGSNYEPFMRFNFTLNQTYGINWIHVSMEQMRYVATGTGEDCAFVIANFSAMTWQKFYLTDATTEVIGFYNYTGGFSDIMSGNKIVLMSSAANMDPGEGCAVDFVNVTVGYTSMVNFSGGSTNNSNAMVGEYVNFSINVSTNDNCLLAYRFSSNFSGTWENSSWISFDGCNRAAEISYSATAPSAGTYGWRFYVNSSLGTVNGSNIQPFNFSTRKLSANWASASEINSTRCSEGSPCRYDPSNQFIARGNVSCSTNPPGLSCGSISGGVMFNNTASGYAWISTNPGDIPFYVREASNPLTDFATLSDGQSYEISYTVNATYPGIRKLIFNFTSGIGIENYTEPAYLNVSGESVYGNLSVNITFPQAGSLYGADQNATFVINATVNCTGTSPDAICGTVDGRLRYNASSAEPDTSVSETSGSKPFFTISGNPKSCGFMVYGDTCKLSWVVNASGDLYSKWKMDVLFNSSYEQVGSNETGDFTVQINIPPVYSTYVERGFYIAGTGEHSITINLSRNFTINRTFYLAWATAPSSTPRSFTFTAELVDNGNGNADKLLIVRRGEVAMQWNISYEVVTARNMFVQHGSVAMPTGTYETTKGIGQPVALNASWVIVHARCDSGTCSNNAYMNEIYVKANLSDNNTINFSRDASANTGVNITYQVVNFTDGTWVQNVRIIMASGTSAYADISKVNLSRSFVYHSYSANYAGMAYSTNYVIFYNSTRLEMVRLSSSASYNITAQAFVVQFPDGRGASVQSGLKSTSATTDLYMNDTIPNAVNLSRAYIVYGQYAEAGTGTGTTYPRPFWALNLTNSTLIEWWRGYNGQSATIAWQAVEHPITMPYGFLVVSLDWPPEGSTLNIGQNYTFQINSSARCAGYDPEDTCGPVQGIARYNLSSKNPDSPISAQEGAKPFFTISGNPQACGEMAYDSVCNLSWTVNASGPVSSSWLVDANFSSENPYVKSGASGNATVNILECVIDVTLWFDSILFSNSTYQPFPNSYGNPAINNSRKKYNITVNPGSCVLDIYIKSTDLVCQSPYSTIGVSNMSFNSDAEDYATSTRLLNSYQILKASVQKGTTFTNWFWIDLPPSYSGKYNGTVTIASVKEGESP